MLIFLIGGARPNFMKVAPVYSELSKNTGRYTPILVHTGQHYDDEMSRVFFDDLELPEPDIYLNVGSASHAVQTARIMVGFEKVCLEKKPDLVMVVGDVNSTLACGIVASKLCIPVAHIEAGLRSFDRTMPEEINRVVTDSLYEYLFTTCEEANENLKREGIAPEKIHFVGNVMIDTLFRLRSKALLSQVRSRFSLHNRPYGMMTLHRPSNVDNRKSFETILEAIAHLQKRVAIVFPMHPRTKKRIGEFGLQDTIDAMENLIVTEPLGYLDFLNLLCHTTMVLTDSGGLQEETTVLGIPCLTIRENTERPVTVREGTNTLVGPHREVILKEGFKILDGKGKTGKIPGLWDGNASQRIGEVLNVKFKPG